MELRDIRNLAYSWAKKTDHKTQYAFAKLYGVIREKLGIDVFHYSRLWRISQIKVIERLSITDKVGKLAKEVFQ